MPVRQDASLKKAVKCLVDLAQQEGTRATLFYAPSTMKFVRNAPVDAEYANRIRA